MTKYIKINKRLYYKDMFVGDCISFDIVEKVPDDTKKEITWDTLNEIGILTSGYVVWKMKKGRIIYLDINKIFPKAIKEWKQRNLDLTLCKTYREITPSFDTIIQFYDPVKAALYFKEHFKIEIGDNKE